MFKGKFGRYAIAFCILGIVYNFMYSGLQNDQINILQGFSAWNDAATLAPLTAGNVVAIVMTFIYGSLFIKFGPRKVLIPCFIVSALGCAGIALANGLASVSNVTVASAAVGDASVSGNYTLYAVSLFCIRITAQCFQLAGFMMASNWFIKYRGRVLGIITMGSPLFSVIGTSVMSTFISTSLGGDYRPFYYGIAIILVVLAILTAVLLKDKPEDDGLFPDGDDHAPLSEAEQADVATLGEVIANSKTWVMIINFGCFNFIINACMASMVLWFRHLATAHVDLVSTGAMAGMFEGMGGLEGAGAMVLFVGQAAKWLSVGAILGIPMSFVFGWIDDKLGTPIACIVLGLTELIPITGLLVQKSAVASTGSCNVPMLVLWGFGVACMTGGVPTMNPASIGYAFGRREYATASRFVMAIQLIPMAFAAQIMAGFINGANDTMGWYMLYAIVAVGIIFCIPMFKWGDAMAADRN
ncbi:MAG: MFS transporter [Eubacterium sp.]|nr:MFS transporter [Eubacterium sp.]